MLRQPVFTPEVLQLEQTITLEARNYNRMNRIPKEQITYILMKPARDKILIESGYGYDHTKPKIN